MMRSCTLVQSLMPWLDKTLGVLFGDECILHMGEMEILARKQFLPSLDMLFLSLRNRDQGFPGGALVKNLPANAGSWVRALVWEDPICHGATKPVCHNYWARVSQLLKPVCLEPVLHNKRSHHNKKPVHRNKENPPLATTRESPRTATKTQCSQN